MTTISALALISGVVGIIGCVIGVATFSSVQLMKAKWSYIIVLNK